MSLSSVQWDFLQDVAKLIEFAKENGYKLTGGELYRTTTQQAAYVYGIGLEVHSGIVKTVRDKKRSTTMDSQHLKRLAIDFNVFKDLDGDGYKDLTYKKEDVQLLGDFWESIRPENEWGGNWDSFKDIPHFQRNL
ncbi:M15 family metallopeptidase [Hydrogenimonas sp.]